jgi:hypothetical protein
LTIQNQKQQKVPSRYEQNPPAIDNPKVQQTSFPRMQKQPSKPPPPHITEHAIEKPGANDKRIIKDQLD